MSSPENISVNVSTRAQNSQRIKMIVTLGMLVAIAYAVMWVCKPIPKVVGILQFDFKDMVIVIGGFLYGPLAAAVSAFVVALIEMVTASVTGPFGLLMNFLSTASFCVTASFIYKRRRTQMGAVIGLTAGVVVMAVVMVLWNFLITPIYMVNVTREQIIPMLPTVFLPFNLVKGGLNMAAALLLYKPVVGALRAAKLVPESDSSQKGKLNVGFLLFALALLATFVVLMLVLAGII